MILGGGSARTFRAFNTVLLLGVLVVTLYPLWHVLMISFSDPLAVMGGQVSLLPVGFELASYESIVSEPRFWSGYASTLRYTVSGVLVSVMMTTACAYALSKRRLKGRTILMVLIIVTMFFNGGLIPRYLLVRGLGLFDTLWAIVLPMAIVPFNMILMRVFFEQLPGSLEDSAKIDGANDIQILMRVYAPLSKPIVATIALFYAVDYWNLWFPALIYLNDPNLHPVTLFLRNIVEGAELKLKSGRVDLDSLDVYRYQDVIPRTLKSATIILVVVPILLVYPFVQRYFVKGIMLGSLKGGAL